MTREIVVPVLMHKVSEVNTLEFSIEETTTPIWGRNSESGEVLEIFFADTILDDIVLA